MNLAKFSPEKSERKSLQKCFSFWKKIMCCLFLGIMCIKSELFLLWKCQYTEKCRAEPKILYKLSQVLTFAGINFRDHMKLWWNSLILTPFLVIFDRYFNNCHESYISRVNTRNSKIWELTPLTFVNGPIQKLSRRRKILPNFHIFTHILTIFPHVLTMSVIDIKSMILRV